MTFTRPLAVAADADRGRTASLDRRGVGWLAEKVGQGIGPTDIERQQAVAGIQAPPSPAGAA